MTMNVVVTGFELLDGTNEHIKDELNKLSKAIDADPNYRVAIKKSNNIYTCSINTRVDSRDFNISVTNSSIKFTIDLACKNMKNMIYTARDKHISKKLGSYEDPNQMHNHQVHEDTEVVTKHKDVLLTPISDDEAIEALNNSRHKLYMYLDESTLEVKGVYHRENGYGIITFKAE